MQIRILDDRLGSAFPLPEFETDGAAGLDLRAMVETPITLYSDETRLIPSGVALHIDEPDLAGLVIPRSGKGLQGLVLGNLVGLIDSDYQGGIALIAWNRADDPIRIEPGDRIAQLVFIQVKRPTFTRVAEFTHVTARGQGGLGSTG